MELFLSIAAIIISLFTFINERVSLHDQAYDKFSQLWLDMDQLFVDHPEMHKYFYTDKNGQYADINKDTSNYALALCIAERFRDVFQYTAPLEKHLNKKDKQSYQEYKKMILNSPILRLSHNEPSWSDLWGHHKKY